MVLAGNLAEDLRHHAVAGHGQRQAGIAHDQGIEHAKGAHHAADGYGEAEPLEAQNLAAQLPGDSGPRTVFGERRGGCPGKVDSQEGQNVRE